MIWKKTGKKSINNILKNKGQMILTDKKRIEVRRMKKEKEMTLQKKEKRKKTKQLEI